MAVTMLTPVGKPAISDRICDGLHLLTERPQRGFVVMLPTVPSRVVQEREPVC
jgi:hypothetical protein